MLLLNKVADRMVKEKDYGITMPFDLDHFFDVKCTDPDYPEPSDFWYFYNPFKKACAKLGVPPLAHPVMISFAEAPPAESACKYSLGLVFFFFFATFVDTVLIK